MQFLLTFGFSLYETRIGIVAYTTTRYIKDTFGFMSLSGRRRDRQNPFSSCSERCAGEGGRLPWCALLPQGEQAQPLLASESEEKPTLFVHGLLVFHSHE